MNIKHYLFLAAGFTVAATAVNYLVGNVTALNTSNTITSLNAYLQKANPAYYLGLVPVTAIPAT